MWNVSPRCVNYRVFCALMVVSSLAWGGGVLAQDLPVINPWDDLAAGSVVKHGAGILPGHHAMALQVESLRNALVLAPMEGDAADGADKQGWPVVALPMPDGSMENFYVQRSSVLPQELRERYPEIETFRGVGVEMSTAEARFELTPHGFHGMVLGLEATIYINPLKESAGFEKAAGDVYVAFAAGDTLDDPERPEFECLLHRLEEVERSVGKMPGTGTYGGGKMPGTAADGVEPRRSGALSAEKVLGISASPGLAAENMPGTPDFPQKMTTGGTLRTYRAAIATTGEYTAFHGGTVVAGLSAVTTAVNRLNAVFRREFSLRLTLVGRNDELIFTDAATDPYTNSTTIDMVFENEPTLNSILGVGAFDLGHVFGTGGGGAAALGSTCDSTRKAWAASSLRMPIGDPFVVTYVAHEIGHQLGANHIFNGSTGFCGPNRAPSTAYEPGSGSTIMSYAGICGAENLQSDSDDYYNSHSFDEAVAHVHQGAGRCGSVAGGSGTPFVEAGPSYTIPRRTPFELVGSGNASSFVWEQHDLGPAGPPNTDNGSRPLFRSYQPTSSPSRTFPRLDLALLGVERLGEALPTTSRDLTFRLIGRNNQGGVAHDEVRLRVAGGSGPFAVLEPTGDSLWFAGETATVSWDVAGTDRGAVACEAVDILFSSDGGREFSTVLASGVPNTGSQTVTVPAAVGVPARVKVACSDNIFFALSGGGDFSIRGETTCAPDATTLCLNEGRFLIRIDWRDFSDTEGVASLVEGGSSADSGLFYFFDPDNWEMLVKVIDGCAFNDHFWVFAAATTNVEYVLRVVDTQTGDVFTFTNPLGEPSAAVTDTGAFATCP